LPEAPISAVTASVAAFRAAVECVTAIDLSNHVIGLDLAGRGTLYLNGESEFSGLALKVCHACLLERLP
jgi:hypothetical protein